MAAQKKSASAEDQIQINKFARLHKNYLDIKAELARITNDGQNLADAEDELLLLDDANASSIPMQIGAVFVHFDQETINEKLEQAKEENAKHIKKLKTEQNSLEEELKELRAILYAKFGDNIHLEMDPDE